ncbi:MAG: hypothetical protein E7172_03915 [Firmicutes bacterium]|nr:hypothetical protein [Bacillota bacterium]
MKEATGELNMTVVTVVAVAAVGAFFYAFVWPGIQQGLARNTCANICPGGEVTSATSEACICGNGQEIPITDFNSDED